MSTNLYLVDVSHKPHIWSDEIAHNLSGLNEIFDALKKRKELASAVQIYIDLFHEAPYIEGDYTMKCALFFQQHPDCEIQVIDEYNHVHTDTREVTA